jgi:hypothetical protein
VQAMAVIRMAAPVRHTSIVFEIRKFIRHLKS